MPLTNYLNLFENGDFSAWKWLKIYIYLHSNKLYAGKKKQFHYIHNEEWGMTYFNIFVDTIIEAMIIIFIFTIISW